MFVNLFCSCHHISFSPLSSLPEADKKGSGVDQLVLDFNPDTMEVLVEVHKKLVKKLKPHQINGVKFMWDAYFESLEQIRSCKVPGGAILVHCMGLGKTLPTIPTKKGLTIAII